MRCVPTDHSSEQSWRGANLTLYKHWGQPKQV